MTAWRKFAMVLAPLAILGAILGVQLGPAAASAASPAWRLVSSPDQPHAKGDLLNGVSCSAAADCMAVGDYGSNSFTAITAPLLERWNGARWSRLHPPAIGNPAALEKVSCPSTSFCVAVGYFIAGGKDQPLAAWWNGHAWARLAFPAVPGANEGQLTGVDCFSPTDCIAVGWTNNGDEDTVVIARFNGVTWTMGTVQNGSGVEDVSLAGVSCSTRTWCVAAGNGAALPDGSEVGVVLTSVNQTTWTYTNAMNLPAGRSGFYGVACTGKKTCVAVGWGAVQPNKFFKWVMETGTGDSWHESLTPQSTGLPIAEPADIACTSSQQCLIVGYQDYGLTVTSKFTSFIWTWNGRKLTMLPSLAVPGFRDSYLGAVTCTSGSCWAVGEIATGKISRSLVERS